ncbi:MAG: RagB/SusD family nutrient uptake outer membrane protein, partial [Bacteroidaceae bacterium]|nr:RagB/SusD family nutrient uptake outer membrane protein [Bacteroidaceae bacterium]
FMEGFRLQDLKRWGKGFERKPQDQSLSNGSSLKIDADDPLFVWPIPQHEIESPGANIEPNASNK